MFTRALFIEAANTVRLHAAFDQPVGRGAPIIAAAGTPSVPRKVLVHDETPQLVAHDAVPAAPTGVSSDGQARGSEVVLAHRYWQRRLAGNPAIVGQPILLNGQAFTVIGVAPRWSRVREG